MVLPGISGSTFLLIFGVYVPIIHAIKAVLKFDFTHLDITIVFALGVLLGLAYFARLVKYLFENLFISFKMIKDCWLKAKDLSRKLSLRTRD